MVLSGNINIDALAYSSWSTTLHSATTVSYFFLTKADPSGSSDDVKGFAPMSEEQKAAVRQALATWSAVANISFVEVAEGQGNIAFGTNDQTALKSAGYAYMPDLDSGDQVAVYLNNQAKSSTKLAPGDYGLNTLIHEIGHALGLKHPGNYDATGSDAPGPFLPEATDTLDYTVMSYSESPSFELTRYYPVSPMMYDVLAIQYLYGANTAYHGGDDRYQFSDFSAYQCTWDSGGNDLFDFSACVRGATIDLREGHFSSTSPNYRNISIAYGVTIERALGGRAADTIYCNDAGDTVDGADGDDILYAGAGSDVFIGGGGTDTVVFAGSLASFTLGNSGGSLLVRGQGSDSLSGVERLQFGDVTVLVSELAQVSAPLQDLSVQLGASLALDASGVFAAAGGSAAPQLSASLADGGALPGWLHFDGKSFSGTPASSDQATLAVALKATNSAQVSVVNEFHLKVGSGVAGPGAGNDRVLAHAGNESIDGGAGLDTVVYGGARSQYTVRASGVGFSVSDTQGDGGIDTLVNVERLAFADGALALDIGGNAGQVYRLYQAAFNRTPDGGGLGYWIGQMDSGASLGAIAAGFVSSKEFADAYGAAPANRDLVTQYYQNILHRAPEANGLAYWVDVLERHQGTAAQVLAGISESGENVSGVAALIGNGIAYMPYGA